MVFVPEEKLRQKMQIDGSVLKYMYSVAGVGLGLIAMGGMCIFIGILLGVALYGVIETNAVILAAVIIVPSILLILLGSFLQKRRVNHYQKAYEKQAKLTPAQIHEAEEEFKQQGTVLISFEKSKSTNSLKKMGFITSHYLKFPGPNQALFPLQNMVACFYTKKYLCQDGGYDRALVAYTDDGDLGVLYKDPPEKACLEMIDAIAAHNPLIITDHHFSYEGREYDAVRQPEEVISLHRRMRAGQ